ncbi:DUF2933 domain-containing protein [Sphingopyxis sp.]|jgi:hypothetical protein|uniref:DUF2933 domain-containing protein n=1 Tax=Sphingopyxis sp. TaxID=1908224 RepID=UPI0025F33947|nr:DUF2933 domain-containing protein [Sphingopyxis sp.]MBK6414746.1 DUF2933 domain-containing protein [Sphingopyxis sp.]
MSFPTKRAWLLAALSAGLVTAYLLYPEHRPHFFGLLPFAFLFVCPLLHFFHGGHHHGQHRQTEEHRP